MVLGDLAIGALRFVVGTKCTPWLILNQQAYFMWRNGYRCMALSVQLEVAHVATRSVQDHYAWRSGSYLFTVGGDVKSFSPKQRSTVDYHRPTMSLHLPLVMSLGAFCDLRQVSISTCQFTGHVCWNGLELHFERCFRCELTFFSAFLVVKVCRCYIDF